MEKFIPDTNNERFQLAAQLINQSARNIFLTGRAGTGKTTFLKYIREHCPKQMVVVAPTGVAAINAGGVTIHSFFQLPLSPFIPESSPVSGISEATVDRHFLLSRLRMNKEKITLLQQLELLIIDEVSMVRADTMDAIDTVLRHIRRKPAEKFGGIQVLMIGDLYQLPPVRDDENWKWLSLFYENPFFFSSRVIREEMPLYVEFNKIYRQRDEQFIRLLNQVRNNQLDAEGRSLLESRFQPVFRRGKDDDYIILTTHNETAREINSRELNKIDSPAISYEASRQGDFNANVFPADEMLYLKKGARVMFLKNDMDRRKRYYNGKAGIITKLDDDKIYVQCKGEADDIEVKRETWQTIRYELNKETRKMEELVLGSYIQFPLRLAWAITIHKSQGLTFEKAIIDAGKAFTPGQVYVALSRCTSLEGIILQTPIRPGTLVTDNAIDVFTSSAELNRDLQTELAKAIRDYRLYLLTSTFDFDNLAFKTDELKALVQKNSSTFTGNTDILISQMPEQLKDIQQTSSQFRDWLKAQFNYTQSPEISPVILDKIKSGSFHFTGLLQNLLSLVKSVTVSTGNQTYANPLNENLREIHTELSFKMHLLAGYGNFFDSAKWHDHKSCFIVPSFYFNAYAGRSEKKPDIAHPRLHQELRKLRDRLSAERQIPGYIVAGTKSIQEMAQFLPQTPEQLIQIHGFGKAKVERYGSKFLGIINDYCDENGLSSSLPEITETKKIRKKSNSLTGTRAETFTQYKEGKSLQEIADRRNLTLSTIESHLSPFISNGNIKLEELLSPDKIKQIEKMIPQAGDKPLSYIKSKLGNQVSFNEIRWVLAAKAPEIPIST